jgi:hypothetical protein
MPASSASRGHSPRYGRPRTCRGLSRSGDAKPANSPSPTALPEAFRTTSQARPRPSSASPLTACASITARKNFSCRTAMTRVLASSGAPRRASSAKYCRASSYPCLEIRRRTSAASFRSGGVSPGSPTARCSRFIRSSRLISVSAHSTAPSAPSGNILARLRGQSPLQRAAVRSRVAAAPIVGIPRSVTIFGRTVRRPSQ